MRGRRRDAPIPAEGKGTPTPAPPPPRRNGEGDGDGRREPRGSGNGKTGKEEEPAGRSVDRSARLLDAALPRRRTGGGAALLGNGPRPEGLAAPASRLRP